MGTNFYSRIIPKEEEIKKVQKEIELYLSGETLTIEDDILKNVTQEIHLGKRSCGWQFLWQDNPKYYKDNLESIKKFLSRADVVIYDEYGERFTVDEFFDSEIGKFLYNDPDKFMNGRQYAEKQKEPYEVYGEWTSEDGLRFVDRDFS